MATITDQDKSTWVVFVNSDEVKPKMTEYGRPIPDGSFCIEKDTHNVFLFDAVSQEWR